MEKKIFGIGVSPGIVIGNVYIFQKEELVLNPCEICNLKEEKDKLLKARDKTAEKIRLIREQAMLKLGEENAKIFDAHITILEDEDLFDEVCTVIEEERISAESALIKIINTYKEMLGNVDDEYLKERVNDLTDISDRWLHNILGKEMPALDYLPHDAVVIAYDLTPSDTSNIDLDNIKGFITEIGGRTSHTSIMARSLEIPALVAVGSIINSVKDGDKIILDISSNLAIVNPDNETIKKYNENIKQYQREQLLLKEYSHKEAVSLDGTKVKIYANIGSPADMQGVIQNGAEGIGLYRTEFLFMGHTDFPSEDEQYEAYKTVALAMEGHTVTIRTMDIGGDKFLPYLEMPKEENPALGWRALRICLDRTDILKTQYRALLRASQFGKIKVMLPMIVSIDELLKSKEIFNECKEELKSEKIEFNEFLELGIMVETPSVVFRALDFARESDFFSIGTNDLTQYTLAADRGNQHVASLADPFNPSVLQAIKMAIDGAHKGGIVISMCGELAGDLLAVPVLLGMGLDIFSMSPISIPSVKKIIISLDKIECEMLTKRVLALNSSSKVRAEIERFLDERSIPYSL